MSLTPLQKIRSRTEAEISAAKSRSVNTVVLPLSPGHGMLWLWTHSDSGNRWVLATWLAGILCTVAAGGFFAGKNDFFLRFAALFAESEQTHLQDTVPINEPVQSPKGTNPADIKAPTKQQEKSN